MIPQQAHDEMRWMDPEHDPIRCVCCCWDCDIEEDDLAEDRAERVTKWMREPEAGITSTDAHLSRRTLMWWQVRGEGAAGEVAVLGLTAPAEAEAMTRAREIMPDFVKVSVTPVPPLCGPHSVRHACGGSP